jgi:hypothetical protein
VVGAVLLALAACAAPGRSPGLSAPVRELGDASRIVVEADWNDVEGSVAVALGQAEVASEGSTIAPDSYTYALRSVGAIPGTLTITRAPGAGDDRPAPITLTCRFGHFRTGADRQREQRGLGRVAARLRDLAGRDYAPLR